MLPSSAPLSDQDCHIMMPPNDAHDHALERMSKFVTSVCTDPTFHMDCFLAVAISEAADSTEGVCGKLDGERLAFIGMARSRSRQDSQDHLDNYG